MTGPWFSASPLPSLRPMADKLKIPRGCGTTDSGGMWPHCHLNRLHIQFWFRTQSIFPASPCWFIILLFIINSHLNFSAPLSDYHICPPLLWLSLPGSISVYRLINLTLSLQTIPLTLLIYLTLSLSLNHPLKYAKCSPLFVGFCLSPYWHPVLSLWEALLQFF